MTRVSQSFQRPFTHVNVGRESCLKEEDTKANLSGDVANIQPVKISQITIMAEISQ
jgi:hypothetical protein